MNIVERKRRLAAENMSGANVEIKPYGSQVDNDTEGEDSEEGDIFERKARFEKLLKKFQDHRKEKGLLLRGNDLRSNMYLKKMKKLAMGHMGLDVIGYKDYTNNLKMFADLNTDMSILARDNFDLKHKRHDYKAAVLELQAQDIREDKDKGAERAKKYHDIVLIAVSKLMREGHMYINERDKACIDELCKNLELYMTTSHVMAAKLDRFYKHRKHERLELGQWDELKK
jgi:hypothetical protein